MPTGFDERKGKWGNIIYHNILLWGGGGGGGKGELGNTKVSIVYSIRMGGGGGGGGGKNYAWGEVHPLCSLSPSVSNLIN